MMLPDLLAGRLRGATHLDLRNSGLTEIPGEVFSLADTLTSLDLSGNLLDALPADLPRLTKLRTLFCSNNRFTTLPAVLGDCASLDIVGFKANAIDTVPPESVPASLRWLILTDNRIGALPDTLCDCLQLQKLMLAGNRLAALPGRIGALQRLELLRISANRFETAEAALPFDLLALPRLAWIAFGGNPFNAAAEASAIDDAPVPHIDEASLDIGELLGEGASGLIHAATWRAADGIVREVAVKRFKGAVTSDGLPRSEMAACIAAGAHPHIVGVVGEVVGNPALVMNRIPAGYRNLAGPPSLASCTRDVYADDSRLTVAEARSMAEAMSSALAHLHARGLMHGDLYAHNILVDADGHSLLGDFGAASLLPTDDDARSQACKRIERRALRCLVDELAARCGDADALSALRPRD